VQADRLSLCFIEQLFPQIPNDTATHIDQLPSLGDIPLVVATINPQEYVLPRMPNVSSDKAMKIWLAAQSALATLSTRGKQIFVNHANHYSILDSHVEDVIGAITLVLNEARK
jgi:hypothetical protein